jgi:hypothetical protein
MTPEEHMPESVEDYNTRMNLFIFFDVACGSLQQLFDVLRDQSKDGMRKRMEHLNVLRNHALDETRKGVRRLSQNRTSSRLREGLRRVGMYGELLKAKLELLWDCLRDGTLEPILKTLNSILGSLGGVLHFAELLKEFKENMEVAADSLGKDGGLISLRLDPPSLF